MSLERARSGVLRVDPAVFERAIADERRGEPGQDAASLICLRAWRELETCRSIGMALGPIPITAVLMWCAAEGLDRDATDVVREVVRAADNQFLEKQASRQRLRNMTGGQ